MDLASIFLLNLAFPLFFELSLCQTDCNGCCDRRHYSVINEPRRSIDSVWKRGHTAICDRTLSWGWYRFTSYVGGQMPTSRVNPYHCGTIAPIWLSGQHPSSVDLTVTVKACINFYNISDGCSQSFNVKIRQCSGESPPFYVYYLRPTYSCAVAYCAGTTKPCDYGQVYSNGECVAAPAEFNRDFLGEPKITPFPPDSTTAEVDLKCEVRVDDFIRSWKNVTYQITWYSEGKRLNTAHRICESLPAPLTNSTIIPDYEFPCLKQGVPLFSRLMGKEYNLHRWISCNVTARHFRSPLSPWCIPKTVRKPFFAGIKVSPSLLTVEECSTKEYTFNLTPTIPVVKSPHTDKYLKISFYLPPNIQMKQCHVELRDTKTESVRVIAQCTNSQTPASKIDKVIMPEIRDTHSEFWTKGTHLPAVWLSVKAANEIHYCGTWTDPHYYPLPVRSSSGSWDQRPSFTFMGHGDFILYKNTERNFEVHTRQWACVRNQNLVTCNCGLVLRDHNDVIEFNCCNERRYFDKVTPMRVKVRSKQRLAPGISITRIEITYYVAYKVLFPSGVKVSVFRNDFGLNINLYTPRAKQRANESGLCLYDNQLEPDVNQYGSRFRLNHLESFFDVLPSPINDAGVRYDIPCSCDKKDERGNPICKNELPTHYFNILDQQGQVVVPSGSDGLGRKKRDVEDSDDLTDEDFDLFQRLNFGSGVHNRVRRAAPAVSRFSNKNATHYCRKLIADTDISKSCAKIGSNVQALVNSCSIDLELSGDTSFALSAVTLLMNECGEIIGRNISTYVNESSEEKPVIPPELSEIVQNLCPSDCTFNGRCVNRTCICNHGFTANDCSISIYQIPDISILQGDGLCDRRKRTCKKVTVMGSGFLNSTNMTCHVKEFTVTNSSWTPKETAIRTTGVMTDLVLAECQLPESPVRPGYYHEVTSGTPAAGLVISMSNDGEHKSSRNLTFISYDSACMSCNVTTGCVLKKNSCFINNYCFATNEGNPINWCQQCIPNISERTWTKRQVNLAPQFLSTNQYYALSQEDLELGIDVSDPEGMPVTLTLTDGSPTKAVMRDKILLWNATDDANTRFSLKATDACGAVSTLNITVNLVACQCQNGSCVPHRNKPRGSGFYECNCIPGFTGAKCETNIDDCQSYPCLQGYCIDEVNQFKCVCNRGYVGKKCEIDYDDCGVSPCAHGNCTDYPGTYRCACDSGYGGQNCSIDIDECQSSPCRHGTCVDQINGYKCQCQPGYTGVDCDVDIDECQSSPCINGTCVNKVNGYNCVCQAGFNGTRCENNINECLLNSCGNGICVDKVNNYSCTCNAGFTGPQCDVAITDCSNDSCYPGVPCTEQISHIVCGPCPSGFTGDGKICKDIDDCVNHTCLNGGSCVDDVNNYTCRCVAGFKGDRCEKNMDDCVNHTCANGGLCVDGVNSYTCNCSAGYTGERCLTDIDDCVNHTCANSGLCVDGVNSYACNCSAAYTGERCLTVVTRSRAEETTIMAERKLSMANTPATTFSSIVITTSLKDVLLSTSSGAFTSVYRQQQEESILLTTTSSAALSSSVFKATTSFQMPPSIKKTESVQSSPSSSSGASAVPSFQLPSKSEMTTAKKSFSVRSSSIIPGFTSTQKPETEHVFKMKIFQDWNDELKDTESIAFKALSARLEFEIMKALSSQKDLIGAKVISFSKGSVVAEFQLMFRSKVSSDEALADLKNQISDGNLGNLQVDPASLEQIYPTTQVPTTEDQGKLSFAIIIGISFGGVFIVALITVLLVRHCQKKKLLQKRRHSNVMPSDEAFPDRHKYEVEKGKSEENILYLEEMGLWAKPIEGKENEAYDKL